MILTKMLFWVVVYPTFGWNQVTRNEAVERVIGMYYEATRTGCRRPDMAFSTRSVGRLLRPVSRSAALLEGRWFQPRAWLGLPDSWGTPGRAADPGQGARERVSTEQHQAQEQALDPALEHAKRRPGHSSPHAQGSKIAEPMRRAKLPAGHPPPPPLKHFPRWRLGLGRTWLLKFRGWPRGRIVGLDWKRGWEIRPCQVPFYAFELRRISNICNSPQNGTVNALVTQYTALPTTHPALSWGADLGHQVISSVNISELTSLR